jgi:hypothetical protein
VVATGNKIDYVERNRLRSFNAAFAAPTPHMPCTPPPGGVEAEHK